MSERSTVEMPDADTLVITITRKELERDDCNVMIPEFPEERLVSTSYRIRRFDLDDRRSEVMQAIGRDFALTMAVEWLLAESAKRFVNGNDALAQTLRQYAFDMREYGSRRLDQMRRQRVDGDDDE